MILQTKELNEIGNKNEAVMADALQASRDNQGDFYAKIEEFIE